MTGTHQSPHHKLIELNDLVADRGVWRPADGGQDLNYSDGSETEKRLEAILRSASDLGWRSADFSESFEDWALDYHLSPRRGNLLRALSLKSGSRIFEVGAGCGAVSRYLGDNGYFVDALEGSVSRARLGSLRCSDLDSVAFIHSNFNAFELPHQVYDAVLFIGVLEYARRFGDPLDAPQLAVRKMLQRALGALQPDGIVVVAIENRLGAKYLFGGPEDHFARPWVGLADYPDVAADSGITTFDANTWSSLIGDMGLCHRFLYPLPDYKLPEAVISASGLSRPEVTSLLWQYGPAHRAPRSEPLTPERLQTIALQDAGLFGHVADSFCIVIAKASETLQERCPYDWTVFDDQRSGVENGLAARVGEVAARTVLEASSQAIAIPEGEPLGRFWLRVLASATDLAGFARLLSLQVEQWTSLAHKGSYASQLVDQEGKLIPANFPWSMRSRGEKANRIEVPKTGEDWVIDALRHFWHEAADDLVKVGGLQLGPSVEEFISQVRDAQSGQFWGRNRDTTVAIYWRTSAHSFSEQRRLAQSVPREGAHKIVFRPVEPLIGVTGIRIDPCDHELEADKDRVWVERLTILGSTPDDTLNLTKDALHAVIMETHELQIDVHEEGLHLQISGRDPWFTIDVAGSGIGALEVIGGVEMQLRWLDN